MSVAVKRSIKIPHYTLGEEIFNAISHGIGGALGIAALVLMLLRAKTPMAVVTTAIFGGSMVILYVMSCVYHALSANLTRGKKVLRVLDHCNVFLLVAGTYIPVSLMGVGGALGWVLFGVVLTFCTLGIVFSAIDVDRYVVVSVICHLVSGWSILLGLPQLTASAGPAGVFNMIAGGVMYTVGAILYGVGHKRRYMHCLFHVFCLAGTFFHFWAIYAYLL